MHSENNLRLPPSASTVLLELQPRVPVLLDFQPRDPVWLELLPGNPAWLGLVPKEAILVGVSPSESADVCCATVVRLGCPRDAPGVSLKCPCGDYDTPLGILGVPLKMPPGSAPRAAPRYTVWVPKGMSPQRYRIGTNSAPNRYTICTKSVQSLYQIGTKYVTNMYRMRTKTLPRTHPRPTSARCACRGAAPRQTQRDGGGKAKSVEKASTLRILRAAARRGTLVNIEHLFTPN